MKESLLRALDLPEPFGLTLLILGLILALAPWLAGHDFGMFKVPQFRPRTKNSLRVLGPIYLLVAIAIHIPIIEPSREPPPFPHAEEVVIFDNGNKSDVFNRPTGPPQPTRFKIDRAYFLTYVRTYHWNDRRGSTPGKISLKHQDGTLFGPWEVSARAGHAGVPNVDWFTRPNVTIPAGEYTVIDSEPETWSYNAASNQMGFAFVEGRPIK